jgi:hypothetical protein
MTSAVFGSEGFTLNLIMFSVHLSSPNDNNQMTEDFRIGIDMDSRDMQSKRTGVDGSGVNGCTILDDGLGNSDEGMEDLSQDRLSCGP